MPRILIALDGSEASQAAVAAAKDVSGAGAEFILLTVLAVPAEVASEAGAAIPWRWPGMRLEPGVPARLVETKAQAMDAQREDVVTRLEILARELRRDGFGVRCGVAFGDPADEILRVAEDEGADGIAVATHGMTGLRGVVMGSVASALVRARTRPIIVGPAI